MSKDTKLFTSLDNPPLDFDELMIALETKHSDINLPKNKDLYNQLSIVYNMGRVNQLTHMIDDMKKELDNISKIMKANKS